jgi:dihydrofolate reductase
MASGVARSGYAVGIWQSCRFGLSLGDAADASIVDVASDTSAAALDTGPATGWLLPRPPERRSAGRADVARSARLAARPAPAARSARTDRGHPRLQEPRRNSLTQQGEIMGSIKSSLFISLDGVIESPETWHFDYFNDEMGAVIGELMGGSDATLLGRQTYDEFAAYWPNADPEDPITGQMNGSRKYVVSTTLSDAAWQNSTLISGDVRSELTKLKQDSNLGTTGSATLVRWLLEEGLVDELHLLVHPVVVGHGKKLFADGAKVPLRLLSATPFTTGVLHLVYAPAG